MAIAQLHLHSSLSSSFSQNAASAVVALKSRGQSTLFSSYSVSFASPKMQAGKFSMEKFSPPIPMARVLGFFNGSTVSRAPVQTYSGASELADSSSGGRGGDGVGSGRGGGGGDGHDHGDDESHPKGDGNNTTDAMMVLASLGKSLSDLPTDLAQAVQQGRIPGSIIRRFFELEKTPFFRWLLQFGGMKERLLADDLFMTKVAIECGVGTVTKTAAELERRRENFSKELDFVIADVMMAIIADFMLVFLPAPTVPLSPIISKQSGFVRNLFHGCPDNAFQVALTGTSYSLLQRVGAIVRNGGKLFCVATSASIIGTSATNVLIYLRKSFNKDYAGNTEDVPILSTSVAYGFYAAVSSNLRYQFLAGVVEQRLLQPWLQNQKLALSALCFVIRTGNTFLGSLMWVDYARWVGVQKIKDDVETTV